MANPHGYSQTGIDLLNAELAKRGIGPAAASGAIAGIMGESGANLDPTSFNSKDPGGGSGGIGQWNRGRLIGPNGMLAFAKNAGVDVNPNSPLDAKKVPLATQAQYLGHELDTTYAGVTKQLQTAANPQDALNIWVKSYENPADPGAAIAQRSQYLAPVGKAIGSAPAPGKTLNSPPASGAPPVAAGGSAAPPATGQPAAGPGGWPGQLASALKPLSGGKGGGAGGGDATDQPQPMQLPMPPPARAAGGPMMMGLGGQNVMGQRIAQNDLAQQGFMMQPSLAAFTQGATRPPVPSIMPGQATGMTGLPGTTLNSPSQLQMALMTGAMSPYDLYGNAASGGGFPTGSY